MKYCHQCGYPNEDHNQYCEKDGSQLDSVDTSYRFELSTGAFCTSCGHTRSFNDVYCAACGHHALEPTIGFSKVEESLKSVAATGSQVLSQLKQVTKGKRVLDYKTIKSNWLIRPDTKDLSKGALFGLSFLIIMLIFASVLVSFLPNEVQDGLRETFGSKTSTFSLTALTAILLTTNVYWTFNVEKFFTFIDGFDEEVNAVLTNFPVMTEIKYGNYFFALGGIFIMILISVFLFRGAAQRKEIVGRSLGLIGSVSIGLLLLSFFSMDVTFIETMWIRTILTTLLSFVFVIGLGVLLSLRVKGLAYAAQSGLQALIVVTLISTIFGTGYYAYQMNSLLSNEASYEVEEVKPLLMVQGALSNWQSIGHGGTQEFLWETPVISMKLSTSAFGTTVPKEIESSITSVGSSIYEVEGIVENFLDYGELPSGNYATPREFESISPSLIGLARQAADASYANDDIKLERLYEEGIFSWFKVLVIVTFTIYTVFAYRAVYSKETLFIYASVGFAGYLIWQWFLNGHMIVAIKETGITHITSSGINTTSMFFAGALIVLGGALGWILRRNVKPVR
ncbi:zinc ribbon domain-containing protein [Exiguobacterium sp. s151]|uniref:zinc ribbon domain-containing protein n=1 Tax=Exiguobacterium sp. s151 TaxID=2751229 RepID=UPI001BE9F7A0|nr:zinc ribbon domain-containing protein [Exiguobacterium sp. s151]